MRKVYFVKWIAPVTVAVVFIMACMVSGCGSGGSGSTGDQYTQKVYIIGEIKDPETSATGEISEIKGPAAAVNNVFVKRVTYDGTSADAPIFMAADQALLLSDTMKQGILATYLNGYPIILVRGDEAQINALLGILGFEQTYKLPDNFSYAELFAVSAETGGKYMWAMFPPGATQADSATDAYIDGSNGLLNRAGLLRSWMNQNGSRTSALTAFTSAATSALASEGASDVSESNLRNLAQVYQQVKVFTDPISGNNYQLIYNMYSCHSFSSSDGKNYDWFYVEQNGTLSGSAGYKGISNISYFDIPKWISFVDSWWWVIYEIGYYYIGSYNMSSSMMSQGGDTSDRSVTLESYSPETNNNQTTTQSGMSYTISGMLGFNASEKPNINGSVTGGLTVNHSDTITTTDCTVENKCTSSGYMDEARWLYTLKKMTQYGWLAVDCKLNNPVSLSVGTFAPYNKWIWKFSPDVRNGKKKYKDSFKTTLDVENMASISTWAIAWVPVSDPMHISKKSSFNDTVTLSYPPLIVAPGTNVTFSAEGQVKYMDASVSSDWSASSDKSWCQAVPTTGTGDNTQVSITVSQNTTGKERKATVTFKTNDGKGKDTMTVTQSQY